MPSSSTNPLPTGHQQQIDHSIVTPSTSRQSKSYSTNIQTALNNDVLIEAGTFNLKHRGNRYFLVDLVWPASTRRLANITTDQETAMGIIGKVKVFNGRFLERNPFNNLTWVEMDQSEVIHFTKNCLLNFSSRQHNLNFHQLQTGSYRVSGDQHHLQVTRVAKREISIPEVYQFEEKKVAAKPSGSHTVKKDPTGLEKQIIQYHENNIPKHECMEGVLTNVEGIPSTLRKFIYPEIKTFAEKLSQAFRLKDIPAVKHSLTSLIELVIYERRLLSAAQEQIAESNKNISELHECLATLNPHLLDSEPENLELFDSLKRIVSERTHFAQVELVDESQAGRSRFELEEIQTRKKRRRDAQASLKTDKKQPEMVVHDSTQKNSSSQSRSTYSEMEKQVYIKASTGNIGPLTPYKPEIGPHRLKGDWNEVETAERILAEGERQISFMSSDGRTDIGSLFPRMIQYGRVVKEITIRMIHMQKRPEQVTNKSNQEMKRYVISLREKLSDAIKRLETMEKRLAFSHQHGAPVDLGAKNKISNILNSGL